MGAGSFKADVKSGYESCIKCDNGSICSAAIAAFTLISLFPSMVLMYLFTAPSYLIHGDHLPFLVMLMGVILAAIPCLVLVIVCLPFAMISFLLGALYGLLRKMKRYKE